MIQINGVYEFILRFLGDSQGKSERFEHKEARSQDSVGEDEEVEDKNEHEEEMRVVKEGGAG